MVVSCLCEEEPTKRDIHEAKMTRGRYWHRGGRQELEPEVVRKAHALEMEWYRKMNVYERRPIEECFEKSKRPIRVKWVDRNTGDRQHMNVRSFLVAEQINTSKEQGLFAAMRPLEALRMLLSATVRRGQDRTRRREQMREARTVDVWDQGRLP